jgi:soluble lytic murein transglycosylase
MQPRFRRALLLILLALSASLWAYLLRVPPAPPEVIDPFADAVLAGHRLVRDAIASEDLTALRAGVAALDGYAAYRAHALLARAADASAAERLAHFDAAMALRVDDPLERSLRRELHLTWGEVAVEAGEWERALAAFREALPLAAAVEAIAALDLPPHERAAALLAGRAPAAALALAPEVPSIAAPAQRALGAHEAALAGYRAWLALEPGSRVAREGEAWSLFALERFAEADAVFAALGSAYGRGLIAGREGRIDAAVAFMRASAQPAHLWTAAGWLEARGRWREAIDVHLTLAAGGDAVYADDAAHRAWVLAQRLGDAGLAARAAAAVPADAYFAPQRGEEFAISFTGAREWGEVSAAANAALAVARALLTAGDRAGAKGEGLLALRGAASDADALAVAEFLVAEGLDFRHPARWAQGALGRGEREVRVWALAYPLAFAEETVAAASEFGVDPALLWAVMKQESAFAVRAVSTSNAAGLMQVIPSTWAWIAERLREEAGDPFDPGDNLRYAAWYVRFLLDLFGGDVALAVASYNGGQGYVGRLWESAAVAGDKDEWIRAIDRLETREYVQRVAAHAAAYAALADVR